MLQWVKRGVDKEAGLLQWRTAVADIESNRIRQSPMYLVLSTLCELRLKERRKYSGLGEGEKEERLFGMSRL